MKRCCRKQASIQHSDPLTIYGLIPIKLGETDHAETYNTRLVQFIASLHRSEPTYRLRKRKLLNTVLSGLNDSNCVKEVALFVK